jgi:serine/threonine protein kinase
MPSHRDNPEQRLDASFDERTEDSPSTEEVVSRLDRLWVNDAPASPSPFASLAGTQVGPYTIERVIGRGGFGIVYKARDWHLNRDVALKVPRPEVLLDDQKLGRFESEALTAAHLDHPSIVPLYDAELRGATPYLASAYCPGPNLQQWLDETPGLQPGPEAARFVATVAEAVQYAHAKGIVHRDLKPSNILLMPVSADSTEKHSLDSYEPRLTDFGLSRFAENSMAATRSIVLCMRIWPASGRSTNSTTTRRTLWYFDKMFRRPLNSSLHTTFNTMPKRTMKTALPTLRLRFVPPKHRHSH